MLSIPKYPEQYAQHFPTIFYLLCCASQHHVTSQSTDHTHTHTHTHTVQGCAVPEDEEMEDSPPGATATEEDDSIL